jgi:hypothetical protein
MPIEMDARVLRHDAANELISSIEDPITQRLMNNAMFHFLRTYYQEKRYPAADFDMLYFVQLLRDIFEEHEVLQRILAGERVGALFDDDNEPGSGRSR